MRVKITLFFLFFITYIPSFAQVSKGDAVEYLWQNNESKWEQQIIKKLHTNPKFFQIFLQYYSSRFGKDRSDFFFNAFQGKITDANVTMYFTRLSNAYSSLFHQFEKVKKEYPDKVNDYIRSQNERSTPPITAATCNPACTNLDFGNGTLSAWNAFYAANSLSLPSSFGTTAMTGGPAGAVTKAAQDPSTGNTWQVTLMSGAGVDPYAGPLIPLVAPMGSYSARVGDTTTGFGVGELTNQFTVPTSSNPMLTIQYAVVLEHTHYHTFYQQPWFQIQVLDATGKPIPGCGQYFVVAYDTLNYLKGYTAFPHPINSDTMYCKPWTTVFVPLGGYQGQCITVSFEAADCNGGAHLGYAYVACSCTQLQLQSSSTSFCGQTSIKLTAPPGGTYQWFGPCISGATTNQSASVTCPGTYSVIITSTAGPLCTDTLSINIPTAGGPPPTPFFHTDTVCAGTPTTFKNLSNPISGPGIKFYWDFFNNGKFEDSTTSPTWTFTQGGVYYVRLHETNNGCGMDTTLRVVVDSTNVLAFSAFGGCVGQTVSFWMSSVPSSKYIWNFGDPASGKQDTSTLSFPSHIYTSAGTYTVSLKTVGVHCADSTTQVVTIGATPQAEIVSNQNGCSDSTITFKDKDSTSIFEFEWLFYNSSGVLIWSSFSTLSATTTYTFPGPGTYTVYLYAFSNPSFCEGGDTITVVIGSPPKAAFNTLPSDSVCLNKPVLFSDASKGPPTSWNWNFGDGKTSTVQNPTHTYSSSGTYKVWLNVKTGAGCSDSIMQNITVTAVAGNFNVNTICLHDSTRFTNTSSVNNGKIKSWLWNFGDGKTSTVQNPMHVYNTAGTYNVTLTVTTTNGCDSVIQKMVTVNPGPSAFFANSTACFGSPTQFTDQSIVSGGTITSWNWSFGDGGKSNLQNPGHTYTTVGSYNTVLVVTSTSGCVDSIKRVVRVNPVPTVSFSADTLAGCSPLCVQFTDASTIAPGKDIKWSWNFGAGTADTSIAQNPTYCYKNSGIYNVNLTVTSDSGCTANQTINRMITVYAHPAAAFIIQPQPVNIMEPTANFIDKSVALGNDSIVSYFWIFLDNNSTSMLQNPSRTYSDTGTYCAKLIVKNTHGCIDTTVNCVVVEPLFTFYIPTAFTPNGNGMNDNFGPEGKYVKIFEMYIFNRWGSLIYHTTDLTKPWDGRVNGNMAQEDTYVYLIKVTDTENMQHSFLGRVTLLR